MDAFVVALQTLFEPPPAGDDPLRAELRVDGQPFALEVADGRLSVARGASPAPDLTLEGQPGALAGWLWHGSSAAEAGITTTGSRVAIGRLRALFPPPSTR